MVVFLRGKLRSKYVFLTMGAVVFQCLLMLGTMALLPLLLKMELGAGENAALRILKAYQIWNNLFIWGVGAITVVVVALVLWMFIQNTRENKISSLSVVFFGLTIFLCSLGVIMTVSEDLVAVNRDYQQDIAQIEEGTLSTAVVYLGGPRGGPLPGIYNSAMEQPSQQLHFIPVDRSSSWVEYFVPQELTLAYSKEDAYNTGLSVEENALSATRFEIRYTDCVKMIASIERLPNEQ